MVEGVEKPKDRDFIETTEGLIFCVVGYLHPQDRFTAYLKYIPATEGKWNRGRTRYSRVVPFYHVTQILNTYNLLKEKYPQYIFDCPVRKITISSVPHTNVKKYYLPRKRLETLTKEGAVDVLEQKLLDLVDFLKTEANLRLSDFGVTGSILTGNHNIAFSDIDLTIHGLKASNAVKETVLKKREKGGTLEPFSKKQTTEWSTTRAARFPLSTEELKKIVERRWNYGYYKKTYVSFHPIRLDSEVKEVYGDFTYSPKGLVIGTAKITESHESVFLPTIYKVEETEIGLNFEINQLVSYEGMFSDVFREGERVEFSGILEKVSGKDNFYRVLIGGSGSKGSYIKLV
jgi:predicted nucleotidyltransferase